VRRDSLTGHVVAAALAGVLVGACVAGPRGSDAVATARATTRVMVSVTTASGSEPRFVPAVLTVPAGADVQLVFRNGSTESHNLSFTAPLEPVRTETIMGPGEAQTLEFVAPGPGSVRFVCTVHVNMSGELRVTAAASPGP
jgi:plastocyanin